jgi:hypothetical protein
MVVFALRCIVLYLFYEAVFVNWVSLRVLWVKLRVPSQIRRLKLVEIILYLVYNLRFYLGKRDILYR